MIEHVLVIQQQFTAISSNDHRSNRLGCTSIVRCRIATAIRPQIVVAGTFARYVIDVKKYILSLSSRHDATTSMRAKDRDYKLTILFIRTRYLNGLRNRSKARYRATAITIIHRQLCNDTSSIPSIRTTYISSNSSRHERTPRVSSAQSCGN